MEEKRLPTICVDFDGVLHSYISGWHGARIVKDVPVAGAIEWLIDAVWSGKVKIAVYSSRSKEPGGIEAMRDWLTVYVREYFDNRPEYDAVTSTAQTMAQIEFPTQKPAAFMTIDDRAHCFEGKFKTIDEYLAFKPWNKS